MELQHQSRRAERVWVGYRNRTLAGGLCGLLVLLLAALLGHAWECPEQRGAHFTGMPTSSGPLCGPRWRQSTCRVGLLTFSKAHNFPQVHPGFSLSKKGEIPSSTHKPYLRTTSLFKGERVWLAELVLEYPWLGYLDLSLTISHGVSDSHTFLCFTPRSSHDVLTKGCCSPILPSPAFLWIYHTCLSIFSLLSRNPLHFSRDSSDTVWISWVTLTQ